MPDKKEKPISVRLSTKALARLNRLTAELDMNRTSVIQEALKSLEREHDSHRLQVALPEAPSLHNGAAGSEAGDQSVQPQSGA